MPVFHTKTIESILEPVAFQVSRLVILHEEAEDGNPMPDLSKPVQAVSLAVDNLIKVGKDTINRSNDHILRADIRNALQRVDRASKLLEEAAEMLKEDPYSQQARQLLIEGARGILQGTSSLLLCFDESEVRKIIRACEKVLKFMEVVEVIETNEDLKKFLKDLTPAHTKVTRDVTMRLRELTHQVHRETLTRCLENLRQEMPVLVSSMKIYIQLMSTHNSIAEAVENRTYHKQGITSELNEIIRVLQLTTYDDDEWDTDSLNYMKRALGAMTSKIQAAHDWLEDPGAPNGGMGEKSLRQILDHAERIGARSLVEDREPILKMCSDIRAMVNALCELRQKQQSNRSPQTQTLATNIGRHLRELLNMCTRAIANMELGGNLQPAHTLSGRLDQAQRWLSNLDYNDSGLGEQASQAIIDEARRLALVCQIQQLSRQMLNLCNEAEALNKRLNGLLSRGASADSAQVQALARELTAKLREIQRFIQAALVNKVVDDYLDATLALRQFTEAVLSGGSEKNFADKARNLGDWSKRSAQTARHVATNCAQNKRLAESINLSANQLESQTPQLINAGQIRFQHSNNASAQENFSHMRDHYENIIIRLRNMIDESLDSAAFVHASQEAIRRHTQQCELAISTRQVQAMVDHAASVARLANRVIMVARQETSNSEDTAFRSRVEAATERLQELVPMMVNHAKDVATNIADIRSHGPWRQCNSELIEAVARIERELGPTDFGNLSGTSYSSRSRQETTTTTTTTTTTYQQQQQQQQQQQRQQQQQQQQQAHNNSAGATGSGGYPARSPHSAQSPAQSPGTRRPEVAPRPRTITPTSTAPHLSQQQYPNQYQNQQPVHSPGGARGAETTDDELDEGFPVLQPNQPIMMAAHDLHQEVKQWSSKENEIIAAAKKIALLMAKLSQLVRGESGTKKDLISCAKAVAEASQEVTRLAKEQAKLCTDRRMRTNILQVCERIPTMGTQLRILSTVKATMLGVQGSQEDQEAMDMIVGNAQNLMQSIKETVRACEAASIKIRTDQGVRVRWIRKEPWYT